MDSIVLAVGLTGIILTVILGGGAIWLSLYFHKKSTELNNSTKDLLRKIEVSSSTTELISKEILSPVIATIINILSESTKTKVDSMGSMFMSSLTPKLDTLLEAKTAEEKSTARKEFIKGTGSLLGKLRGELGTVGLSLEPEYSSISAPGASSYNWNPFIQTIHDIENSRKLGFISVKWLRETKFKNDSEYKNALQIAIERRLLSTYTIDNPRKPQYPVLCCKLNKEHPIVSKALSILGIKDETKE